MDRRKLLLSAIFLPLIASPQPVSAVIALEGLVKLLADAGDALSKFTQGISDLVATGAHGYDYVAARRDHDKLIDISARMSNLIANKNVAVLKGIDGYIEVVESHTGSPEAEWRALINRLRDTLFDIKNLLADVEKTRSDFVADEAYGRLVATLSSRGLALGNLINLPAPVSPQEIAILRQANANYARLLNEAQLATEKLNLYVRGQSKQK